MMVEFALFGAAPKTRLPIQVYLIASITGLCSKKSPPSKINSLEDVVRVRRKKPIITKKNRKRKPITNSVSIKKTKENTHNTFRD